MRHQGEVSELNGFLEELSLIEWLYSSIHVGICSLKSRLIQWNPSYIGYP